MTESLFAQNFRVTPKWRTRYGVQDDVEILAKSAGRCRQRQDELSILDTVIRVQDGESSPADEDIIGVGVLAPSPCFEFAL